MTRSPRDPGACDPCVIPLNTEPHTRRVSPSTVRVSRAERTRRARVTHAKSLLADKKRMVGWDGIEPPTPGFSELWSSPDSPPYLLPSPTMYALPRVPVRPVGSSGGDPVRQVDASVTLVRSERLGLSMPVWTWQVVPVACGYMARPRPQSLQVEHARRTSCPCVAISTTSHAGSRAPSVRLASALPGACHAPRWAKKLRVAPPPCGTLSPGVTHRAESSPGYLGVA
jgi:hypothetical protein